MKTHYKDCHGEIISYGDILRDIHWQEKCPKSEYSPKEPFFMIAKCNGETMMYVSGMDEFYPIEDCQLGSFEIFAKRVVYDANLEIRQ